MTHDENLRGLRDETRKLARQIDGMIEGIGVNPNGTMVGLTLICSWPPGSATRMPETIDRVCHWLRSRRRDDQPLTAAWNEAYKAYEGWVGLRGREQENFLFNEIPGRFAPLAECLREIADNNALWPERKTVQSTGAQVVHAVIPPAATRPAAGGAQGAAAEEPVQFAPKAEKAERNREEERHQEMLAALQGKNPTKTGPDKKPLTNFEKSVLAELEKIAASSGIKRLPTNWADGVAKIVCNNYDRKLPADQAKDRKKVEDTKENLRKKGDWKGIKGGKA